MSDLTLRVDEYVIDGWTSVQVDLSLDQLANSFALQLTSELSSTPPPIDISDGSACRITYGADEVLNGYIDTTTKSYDKGSTSFSATGRSKAGDLCDCSAIKPGKVTGGSWKDTNFLKIANDITSPFGITVYCDLGDPVETYFKLQEGESCFDALERLGKDYGLRIVSFPDGDIAFTRTGLEILPNVVIESGKNVVTGSVITNGSERYSDYVFKGQLCSSDETPGDLINTSKLVQDDGVGRYRPLLIETDEQVRNPKGQFTKDKLKTPLQLRAEWERATRAGRSRQLSYDVCNPDDLSLSWEMSPGVLWKPNIIITVLDDFLGINGQFLVTSVSLIRDASGTRTSLRLTFPEAYTVELPPKKKKKGGFSW